LRVKPDERTGSPAIDKKIERSASGITEGFCNRLEIANRSPVHRHHPVA
jgi:hypothetical protein